MIHFTSIKNLILYELFLTHKQHLSDLVPKLNALRCFLSGAGSGLSPMFLTEISPINMRGGMGALHQLAITLGILCSQILGLSQFLGE